jgi:acyl-CoA dehydrogenase
MSWRAPIEAIRLSLETAGGLAEDMAAGRAGGLTPDDLTAILAEAARFAQERLSPENRRGDKIGSALANGVVKTPPGWPALYRAWAEAGWNGVDLPAALGGMGLPTRVAVATMEMWTSACMSFALGPVLTQGAVDALEAHADEALKAAYVPKLVSGEWTATMNLTEPQAGSDLGLLRTKAERQADGTYRITGSKIYITYGEHDLTEQIVHLVLARLPDAPAGTRGISMFLVPKLLPDGSRNGVVCTGLERKLGIHASPTCSMSYDNAVGWLVGEENRGLAGMFTMMNKARLFTGLQGVAIAERALQHATVYAQARVQGRGPGSSSAVPIIAHPDVRRNLMLMRSLTAAGRAVAHRAAAAIDRGEAELAGLLTPIVKAFCSELGVEVASIGVQVHGGMGYVEETGAAQLLRDARITPIYEGTNGIQAIDLLTRKVLRPGAESPAAEIARCRKIATDAVARGMAQLGRVLAEAADALERATAVAAGRANDQERLLAMATPYLQMFSLVVACSALLEVALVDARVAEEASFFALARVAGVPGMLAEIEYGTLPGVGVFALS